MTRFVQFYISMWFITAPVSAQEVLGVYIANQGNFSDTNGSITWYDLSTRQTKEIELFSLPQSITLHGDFGYVASNVTNNVDILDLSTNMRVGQIPRVADPRYIGIVDQNKAYVSELNSDQVRILNLRSRTVSGSVDTGSKPEDIAVVGNRAFVANYGWGSDSTLTVIDIQTDTVIETIDLGCDGPRHLEVDRQGDLWAFCKGNTVYSADFTQILERTNGAAVVLNPQTSEILKHIEFDHQVGASASGQDSCYSPESEEIFLIRSDNSAVLVFDTAQNLQKEPIILSGDEGVGGLAYDANARLFYISRIVSYVEPGFVQIINRDDMLEAGRFFAGIAPSHLVLHKSPSVTAADGGEASPVAELLPAYPNPFNRASTLTFVLEQAQQVSLAIYDALGREVARPVFGLRSAGKHHVVWDAGPLPAGTYFSRWIIDGRMSTGTLVRTH